MNVLWSNRLSRMFSLLFMLILCAGLRALAQPAPASSELAMTAGSGSLTELQASPIRIYTNSLIPAADLDADDHQDSKMTGASAAQMAILFGTGDGSFTQAPEISIPSTATAALNHPSAFPTGLHRAIRPASTHFAARARLNALHLPISHLISHPYSPPVITNTADAAPIPSGKATGNASNHPVPPVERAIGNAPVTAPPSVCAAGIRPHTELPGETREGAVLICIVFICIPDRRRRALRGTLGMMLLLVVLTSGSLACGGFDGSGTGCGPTLPGTNAITVTGNAGTITSTGAVDFTAQ